jgi:sn-glycerol 3-phosphate transport system ATP-binding protein
VRDPAAFLLDEPLSNLDAKLRVQMRVEIKQLQRRLRTTSLYVTHDQLEAMTLGDRLVVLSEGRIEQVGTPMEVYERPQTLFVAGFIGSPAMNLIPVDYMREKAQGAAMGMLSAQTGLIGIRPDDMRLAPVADPCLNLRAHIDLLEPAGAESHLYLTLEGLGTGVTLRVSGQPAVQEGEMIDIFIARNALHPFDPATGRRTDG